jgi:hypothetical protein
MNPMSIATAAMGAQAGLTQASLAVGFERMNADKGAAIVKLIDGAQQNAASLANVATGVGANLDIKA